MTVRHAERWAEKTKGHERRGECLRDKFNAEHVEDLPGNN